MRRIPMISGAEYDAFTRWRRYRKWHAGQRAKIKRRYRRRERREGRNMILEGIDEIRAQGVTVYDYRTDEEKAQPLDVSKFNVPDWARWIAADANRSVFAYEQKPEHSKTRNDWILVDFADCRLQRIATIDMTGIDWRRTLTPVNVEQQQVQSDFFVADVPPTALAWQLAQLDANELGSLARQLAHADTDKANLLAEALWSEAMDVEHAALQADDAAMEESNYRAVWGDSVRHARIWDSIEAQLRAAQ